MSFDIPIADQMRIAYSYVKFKTRQKRLRTADKVIADTIYGKVKGVKWRSVYGTTYYSFEGIPFAKPPVGKLRFKAPEEPEHWTGVRRCTREHPKPCQMNIIMKQVQGREDCLYLNVYTRTLHTQKLMPVLVWIYGGGFQMGEASRDLYSPDYFMMEHVVLISISYRLGPLGFLCLDDPDLDIPGNAGLKDQVLALKWVKSNCHFFGGDPDNITVFGESAGGGSAHYMMITEQTRNLFHKGVVMSGSALAPWANIPQHNWGYRLAKATGYKGENIDRDVLEHLRHCKPSSMVKVCEDLLSLSERHQRLMFSFGPTVEPYITKHCVIPKPPIEMMRDCWGNTIPMLIGGNSFEGLLMFTEVRKYPDLLHKLDCEYLTPHDANLNEGKRKEFGQQLKDIYFGEKKPSWSTILHYSDVFSYKYFWHGIHRTVLSRLHYASAPTYVYRFDFDSKHFNFMRIITCGRKVRGTCHADDLSYMFYNAGAKKLKHRTAEFKTIRRLVSILVQFAETGDPNISLEDMHELYDARDSKGRHRSHDSREGSYEPRWHKKGHKHEAHGRRRGSQHGHSSGSPHKSSPGHGGHGGHGGGEGDKSVQAMNGSTSSHYGGHGHEVHGNQKPQDPHKTHEPHDSASIPEAQSPADAAGAQIGVGSTVVLVEPQLFWLPVKREDVVFKCLNISDELEVIELPEAEKLKLWDRMYEDKNLLF